MYPSGGSVFGRVRRYQNRKKGGVTFGSPIPRMADGLFTRALFFDPHAFDAAAGIP